MLVVVLPPQGTLQTTNLQMKMERVVKQNHRKWARALDGSSYCRSTLSDTESYLPERISQTSHRIHWILRIGSILQLFHVWCHRCRPYTVSFSDSLPGSMLTARLPRHRDFWREVPYMFQDVISHLCSTVRPRQSSSRGGYISV